MINEKYWNDILERMNNQENREKYEKLCKSHTKEDEMIKFHIKVIREYFELKDEEKSAEKYKNSCTLSIKKVNQYFEINDWK